MKNFVFRFKIFFGVGIVFRFKKFFGVGSAVVKPDLRGPYAKFPKSLPPFCAKQKNTELPNFFYKKVLTDDP